jgi:hypothetical protein
LRFSSDAIPIRAWNEVEERLGRHAPLVVIAFPVARLALASLVIDVIPLGPGLDMLGVANPFLH